MARETLETQFIQGKEFLREKWARLTEDDVRQINGRYDQLIDKLLQRYGYTREQAEAEIRKWNFERENRSAYTPNRANMRREEMERIPRNEGSSFLKWAMVLLIPLALLTLLYMNYGTPDSTATAKSGYESVMISAPNAADQTVAQSIRQAFMSNNIQLQDLSNVRLSASNGVVTINGSVSSAQKRDALVRILQNTFGVRQVNNNLEIRP